MAASAPLIETAPAIDGGCAIKDPSVVFHDNRWHVYTTLRNESFAHMEYLSFADWPHRPHPSAVPFPSLFEQGTRRQEIFAVSVEIGFVGASATTMKYAF